MSHDSPILIVDENDKPVGAVPKEEAQKKGLIHRIVQVVVEDPDGHLLLQKRSNVTKLYPGRWDVSVGGHVDEGEDYLEAAKREMAEEIGLNDVKLKELGNYRRNSQFEWRQLNRFYRVYKTVVPKTTKFNPEADEVAELRWFTVAEIQRMLKEDETRFTFSVGEAITRFLLP